MMLQVTGNESHMLKRTLSKMAILLLSQTSLLYGTV